MHMEIIHKSTLLVIRTRNWRLLGCIQYFILDVLQWLLVFYKGRLRLHLSLKSVKKLLLLIRLSIFCKQNGVSFEQIFLRGRFLKPDCLHHACLNILRILRLEDF